MGRLTHLIHLNNAKDIDVKTRNYEHLELFIPCNFYALNV